MPGLQKLINLLNKETYSNFYYPDESDNVKINPDFLARSGQYDYRKLLNDYLINKMNNIFQEELVKYKYE